MLQFISVILVIGLMMVLGSGNVLADERPPLSKKRIANELIAGYGGGFVVGSAGFGTGALLGYALDVGEPGIERMAFIFGYMGLALGEAAGVHYVGSRGDETGSFKATLGGSILGFGMAIAMVIIADGHPLVYENFAGEPLYGISVGAAPAIGATIGFNLTRRYKSPAISDSQTNRDAPAFRLDLLTVRF